MAKKQEIINEIRHIIGGKKFTFSDDYIDIRKEYPTIGSGERAYTAVTKKYLYCDCYAVLCRKDSGNNEIGIDIRKFPLYCDKTCCVHKLELEDMFTDDLKKILDDIRFYLWWEVNVRMPKLKAKLVEIESCMPLYNRVIENCEETDIKFGTKI